MRPHFVVSLSLLSGCFGTVPVPEEPGLGGGTDGSNASADADDGPGQEAGGDETAAADDAAGTGGSSPSDTGADDADAESGTPPGDSDEGEADSSSEGGEPPPPMPVIPDDAILVLEFDDAAPGPYGFDAFMEDWQQPDWENGVTEGRLEIIDDGHSGQAMRIHHPQGAFGPDSGAQWHLPLGGDYDELYVGFWVRFGSDFDFVKGGTLVGLAGGVVFHAGTTPGGMDGWNYRGRWIEDGIASFQIYHMDQSETYGDQPVWSEPTTRYLEAGQWHHIQHRVVMNTPGEADGIIEAWFDGQLAYARDDFRFRSTEALAIDALRFANSFGGGDPSYNANKAEYTDFDDFVIAQSPIVSPPR